MKDHISVDKIINKNEFKILGDNTICSICQDVFYEPIQCQSCQNCFCKECIFSWMKKSKACPFKCEKPEYKENRFVNNKLLDFFFLRLLRLLPTPIIHVFYPNFTIFGIIIYIINLIYQIIKLKKINKLNINTISLLICETILVFIILYYNDDYIFIAA